MTEYVFKSPLGKKRKIIFYVASSLLIFVSSLLFWDYRQFVFLILIVVIFVLFFVLQRIFAATTTIKISDQSLYIDQYYAPWDYLLQFEFDIKDLAGFEVTEIYRGEYSLVVYEKNFKYYQFVIIDSKDIKGISGFLSSHLPTISKDSSPHFESYFSSLLFLLKRLLGYKLVILSLLALCYYLTRDQNFSLNISHVVFITTTSLVTWYYLFYRSLKKHHFRASAYIWFIHLFLLASPIPFIFGFKKYLISNEPPSMLEQPQAIFQNKPSLVYQFKHISYNPDTFLFSNVVVGSAGRSLYVPFHHYATTPLGDGNEIIPNRNYNFWILYKETQSIKKRTPNAEELIQEFHQKMQGNFKSKLAKKKPVFFVLLPLAKSKMNLFATIGMKTPRFYLLEPHWESLEKWKKNEHYEAFYFFAFGFALQLFFILIIAEKR